MPPKNKEHETKEVQRPKKNRVAKKARQSSNKTSKTTKCKEKRAKYKSNPRFKQSAKCKNPKTHTKET